MIKLYGRKSSINVQKVLWCLAELGWREPADFQRIDAGLDFGINHTPEYQRLNPNGLVPTWVEGDFVLWESHAILRYVAGLHGVGSLLPTDPQRRADSDRWMDWKLGTLWPALRPAFVGLTRTPPDQRNTVAIQAAYNEASRLLAMLDRTLATQAWCAGDSFTLGDIVLAPAVLRWAQLAERFGDTVGTAPDLAPLRSWLARATARPAFAAIG